MQGHSRAPRLVFDCIRYSVRMSTSFCSGGRNRILTVKPGDQARNAARKWAGRAVARGPAERKRATARAVPPKLSTPLDTEHARQFQGAAQRIAFSTTR